MLARRRVLIAEDEELVALSLARAVEDADGEVVGPVSSVREGLALLAETDVHAAILDVSLADRDVIPIARALLERGKVVVFHTASPIPDEIVTRPDQIVVCPKPMGAETVVTRLAGLISAGGRARLPDAE
jgi:DNA-binding NarL/FixJ family response regulator